MKSQKAILTLGMHRSGTSAISRILNLLGVDLGWHLMPAGPYNERGFWENMKFTGINDSVLKVLGSSWDDIRSLPDGWWSWNEIRPFIKEIEDLLNEQFATAAIWGVKDPRLCRLLPIWAPVLRNGNYRASIVFIIRHPSEVVQSLCFRDHFSPAKGYLLWLRHVLEGERWSREFKRVFITYERLLEDWEAVVRYVVETHDIPEPRDRKRFIDEVESFLSVRLRHQRVLHENLPEIDPLLGLVGRAYRALSGASHPLGANPAPELEKVAEKLSEIEGDLIAVVKEYETIFQGVLGEKRELERQVAQQKAEIAQQKAEIAEKNAYLVDREERLRVLNDQLQAIVGSRSWKLTRPLRRFVQSLRWFMRLLGKSL